MLNSHAVHGARGRSGEDRYFVGLLDKSMIQMAAVFDGHGGSRVSSWLATHLPSQLDHSMSSSNVDFDSPSQYKPFLTALFEQIDRKLYDEFQTVLLEEGSTLSMILHRNTTTYIVNLGDSRTVVYEFSETSNNIVFESVDHTPKKQDEYDRIIKAGGTVTKSYYASYPWRVNGWLSLSRAFGDFEGKQKTSPKGNFEYNPDGPISIRPDIFILQQSSTTTTTTTNSFPTTRAVTHRRQQHNNKRIAFIASDGVFDCGSSSEYGYLIRSFLNSNGRNLKHTCDDLVNYAHSRTNDDVTLILFTLE